MLKYYAQNYAGMHNWLKAIQKSDTVAIMFCVTFSHLHNSSYI